jgi:hypothetical protein
MLQPILSKLAPFAATALLGLVVAVGPASAKTCFIKAGEGTGTDAKSAKFQVDEVLLQATDWGAWASWMANGTTPGYTYGKRTYRCKPGGLGVTCRGQAKICKL